MPFVSLTPLRRATLLALVLALALVGALVAPPARADSYVPISGSGSTWAQNAVDTWRRDVSQFGMVVNYAGTGSGQGRNDFLNHTVDFAVSDIPFQQNPTDGSPPEHPAAGSYAYIPIVAGGTAFMYHLTIGGQRVSNLRLSGTNIAKIFTGALTRWDDPAIAADNPGLSLPAEKIVPVVRSDSSGSSAQFSLWMQNQQPALWNAYYQRLGRGSVGGETSFWPTATGMIAQSGDLGVAGYVSQDYGEGAIGYVQYSYALNAGYPVAKMLNRAGYYTEPTPTNVAVSLLKAKINMDSGNPAVYLTQDLADVYSDTDSRVYPMSSYSYMILPTDVQGSFSSAKGATLAAFAYFFECAGQQQAPDLGYSPLPVNLVQASFQQILKIPGVQRQNISISSCNNPTFDPKNPGSNRLAAIAPMPQPCDRQGPVQCATGTGGDHSTTSVRSGGNARGTGGGATGPAGTAASAGPVGVTPTGRSSARVSPTTRTTGPVRRDPDTGQLLGAASGGNSDVAAVPVAVNARTGWGGSQTLMLLAALLAAALVLAPPVASRLLSRKDGR